MLKVNLFWYEKKKLLLETSSKNEKTHKFTEFMKFNIAVKKLYQQIP